MQVLEQHGGAGPSDRQKAGMVGERLRLVPQRMANDPGCGSRASDPQGTSEEGRQARLTRPSKIHFHLIWRGNLSQTIAFALLLGGILLITHFRNGTPPVPPGTPATPLTWTIGPRRPKNGLA